MLLKFAFLFVLGLSVGKVYGDEPHGILGGTDASVGELPYQVSLQEGGGHFCGGTIVSSTQIITAAHCVDGLINKPFTDLAVVSGSVNRISGGQSHRIKDIRIHPNYMPDVVYFWVNDAAVIYLEEPMKFNAYQSPIPLATSDPPLGAALTLSGWGKRSDGRAPEHLQKATMYYVSEKECKEYFTHLSPTHICALNKPGIGACSGDSGGPLVYQGRLVGITSFVAPCALGYPDVFTRVSRYSAFFHDIPRA